MREVTVNEKFAPGLVTPQNLRNKNELNNWLTG